MISGVLPAPVAAVVLVNQVFGCITLFLNERPFPGIGSSTCGGRDHGQGNFGLFA